MSKSCANCGAEILEGAPFCDNCGMPVSEAAPPASPRKAPAQPPLTLPEESTLDQRSQLEQGEQLPASPVTLSDGALDPYAGEQRRGAAGWVISAAGIVETAARRVPRWAVGVAAGLVAMLVPQRQGADAVEEPPTADSAARQNTDTTEAEVQDPDPIDQGEENAGVVDDPATSVSPPPITPLPEVTDTPPPIQGPPVVEPSEMVATQPIEEPPVEEPPDMVMTPPIEEPPITEPPVETALPPVEGPPMEGPVTEPPGGVSPPPIEGPPVEEPAMTEPGASRLDPNLTDPTAPGPTLDTGLVVRIEQNTVLVSVINRNPDIAGALARDPTQIDQIEQDLGLAEQRPMGPTGVAELADVSGLDVPELDVPDPGPPDQDLDDQANL